MSFAERIFRSAGDALPDLIGAPGDEDAGEPVSPGDRPGGVGADEIPRDHVEVVLGHDPVAREAVDDQPPDHAIRGLEREARDARPAADPSSSIVRIALSPTARLFGEEPGWV